MLTVSVLFFSFHSFYSFYPLADFSQARGQNWAFSEQRIHIQLKAEEAALGKLLRPLREVLTCSKA